MTTEASAGADRDLSLQVPAGLRVAFLIAASEVSGSARQLVGTVLGLRELVMFGHSLPDIMEHPAVINISRG